MMMMMMRARNVQSVRGGIQALLKNRLLSTQAGAGGEDEVKLLTSVTSPFANSVALALRLKGVEFQALEEQFPNKSPLLLESNPVYKSIPVLIHNGRAVSQTLVILEYIEEAWPGAEGGGEIQRPAFLPSDPYSRMQARFWADFINQKLVDTAAQVMITIGDAHEKAKKEVVDHFLTLNQYLPPAAHGFFQGRQEMGLADIVMSPFVTLMMQPLQSVCEFRLPDSSQCPPLYSWIAAIQENSTVKSTTPDPELILQKMKFYRQVVTSRAQKP